MCVFCEAYGENGGLWYLNPKNYGRQLYRRKRPGEGYGEFTRGYRGAAVIPDAVEVRNDDPDRLPEVVKLFWDNVDKSRPAQVLPLQDAIKMAEIAHPLAAMSCECRLWTRGWVEDNPSLYSCGGLGVGMFKWERWPERYKGGVDFMSLEEAKDWLMRWNKKGMVHIIMTYGAPYVGGLCNCDYPDCGAIRRRLDAGVGTLKSHYVAMVDYSQCNGCAVCVQRCQFGALKLEVTTKKANIDMFRCFGCGLCETGCPRGAIILKWREDIPALRGVW